MADCSYFSFVITLGKDACTVDVLNVFLRMSLHLCTIQIVPVPIILRQNSTTQHAFTEINIASSACRTTQ